jgi:hypothetical protein
MHIYDCMLVTGLPAQQSKAGKVVCHHAYQALAQWQGSSTACGHLPRMPGNLDL